MAEEKTMRLSLVAKQINVGTSTILQFLSAKGHKIDNNPNAKLNFEQLTLLAKEYGANHILESSVEAPKPAPAPETVTIYGYCARSRQNTISKNVYRQS